MAGKVFQSTRPARGATGEALAPVAAKIFQSTRPARGATSQTTDSNHDFIFQSTRPARGATLPLCGHRTAAEDFNPRAPRGARPGLEYPEIQKFVFQSTRPARGATRLALTLVAS